MSLHGTRRGITAKPKRSAGGGGLTYRLREDFTTDAAAPLTSPRTAQPGPGTLTITDTGNLLSISGGSLVASAVSTAANDPRVVSGTEDRSRGLMLTGVFTGNGGFSTFAWDTNNDLAGGSIHALYIPVVAQMLERGGLVLPELYASGMRLTIALQDPGALYFANTKLIFVDAGGNNTPMLGGIAARAALAWPGVQHLYIRPLGGAFATQDGIATLNVSAPASGAAQTGTADALMHYNFTLPGSPVAGDKVELRYRVADATNYWSAYLERNGGGTAWDFKLDSVSAGVASNRITVTGVGTPNAICVINEGSLHDCYTATGYGTNPEAWTKRGSQVSVSHQNSQTAVNVTYAAGTASTVLKSFPRTSSNYDLLTQV